MKTIGLTGGVGMGKSTSADFLESRGIPVVDTDRLAHQLVEPGQPALEEVVREFGAEVLQPDGRLHRGELARRVFADAGARARLEGILHPRIRALWREQLRVWKAEERPVAVVVIPLLYETDAAGDFDLIVCVACTRQSQRDRLLERGWSDEEIGRRIGAQWPVERKMAMADRVVWTEGLMEVQGEQWRRILAAFE